MDTPICLIVYILMPWNSEEISERPKPQNSVPGSSPGEGGFCGLETKQDRRRQRQKLLVSMRILHEHGYKHRKHLCSSPSKMVPVAQELSTAEKQQQD